VLAPVSSKAPSFIKLRRVNKVEPELLLGDKTDKLVEIIINHKGQQGGDSPEGFTDREL
jgi:hypothetical protein